MEEIWDEVLTHFVLPDKGPLYGIAVDDAHNYQTFDERHGNPGRGWVMVAASEFTTSALIDVMERGDRFTTLCQGAERRAVPSAGTSASHEEEHRE